MYKCKECKQWKNRESFDVSEFTKLNAKKRCLKCDVEVVKKEELSKQLNMQIEYDKMINTLKAQNKIAIAKSVPLRPLGEMRCNSYKNVWMQKGNKTEAWNKVRDKFVKYRTIKCQFTGIPKIIIKWKYGGDKWYSLEKMYYYIFPEERV